LIDSFQTFLLLLFKKNQLFLYCFEVKELFLSRLWRLASRPRWRERKRERKDEIDDNDDDEEKRKKRM